MKKFILITLLSVTAFTSCLKNGDFYSSEQLYARFDEFRSVNIFTDPDQEYASDVFRIGSLYFLTRKDKENNHLGGFAIGRKRDTTLYTRTTPFPKYTVFEKLPDKDSVLKENYYAVYKYEADTAKMPETAILFAYPNIGTAVPSKLKINNTIEMIAAVRGLGGYTMAKKGDWVKLVFEGRTVAGKKTSVETFLYDWTGVSEKLIDSWTEVDLSKIGVFDFLDMRVESSRDDWPHSVCIDDFEASVTIGSQK